MVANRRYPQYTTPVDQHIYKEFNFQVTMPQHWEYTMFNTPNKPQVWGIDMKMDLECWHVHYYMGESIQQMVI
jgi:hypothetical protein